MTQERVRNSRGNRATEVLLYAVSLYRTVPLPEVRLKFFSASNAKNAHAHKMRKAFKRTWVLVQQVQRNSELHLYGNFENSSDFHLLGNSVNSSEFLLVGPF